MSEIVQLVEAYEKKHNPSGTPAGRRVAAEEIGKKIKELVEAGKLDVNRVSFKHLYTKLVEERALEEGIVSSAFPVIAGELISSTIIKAYEDYPKVGDSLVTTVPSKQKESKIVGWKSLGFIRQVSERENYSQVNPPEEKYVRIANAKYGGLLDLTKESIFFDQTGELLNEARRLGTEGARFREEKIMQTVCDALGIALDGGDLYNSGNSNLLTTNPLGVAGWENVHVSLLDKKDENGKPIWVMGTRPIMLVPTGLYPAAWKLANNEKVGGSDFNDLNMARNQFDIVTNAYLQKSSTTWWYGDFKSQFRWEEVWPLETFTRVGQDTEEGFNRDVIQQFKVSLYGGCGAVDTRYVYQNEA